MHSIAVAEHFFNGGSVIHKEMIISSMAGFLRGIIKSMVMFVYSATDKEGKIVRGEQDAGDEKALAAALRGQGLLVMDARARADGAGAGLKMDIGDLIARFRSVSLAEKMFFARNLSVMVEAGLSLNRAMEALAEEATSKKFKKIIAEVNASVAKGKTFADSLREHQDVFGDLFINMVEVGETTGKLALVLRLIANQIKRDRTLIKRVRGAMMYPAVILMVLGGVGTLMMIYVIPTLSSTIKDLGVPLPLTTRMIIGISEFITAYGLVTAGGVIALGALAWRAGHILEVRRVLGRWALRLPLFGSLIRKLNTARFCRTLAYLTASGVPIIRSLEITSGVVGNSRFREVLQEAAGEIQKGIQLNVLLARHPDVFQPLVTQMVAVGEETGKIGEMLLRLALFFEEEVASVTKNLSTIIEPILMVVVGALVGIFAVSMLQPIYSSLGSIGG